MYCSSKRDCYKFKTSTFTCDYTATYTRNDEIMTEDLMDLCYQDGRSVGTKKEIANNFLLNIFFSLLIRCFNKLIKVILFVEYYSKFPI